jgi:predicted nucleic acid-binding Zn ribbon protein
LPVGLVCGAILGDRQRMVQVALIFMGIAILILTRGNRF